MFCSTIIPTIGRDSLARAVNSVLTQDCSSIDFEIIVVNDSGEALPEADWQHSERVRIIDTNRRERSCARNTGAAIAYGHYLHFLDDDDWLEPGAFQHFYELSRSSHAHWLYGITQLVDRQGNPIIQLRHRLSGNCFIQVMAGEWIPIQSSLIDRELFMQLGGFSLLLTGPEDIDILRRATLEAEVEEAPYLIAHIGMGEQGSTTDYGQHPQLSRLAREKIIESPHAFQRMRSSASEPYWLGRMVRVYLTSVVWNIQHKRFFTAIDRLIFSVASLLISGKAVFSFNFWDSLKKPYASITFQKGVEAANRAG